MPYEVDWVDAFTDRPFGGNGCAVVYDAAGMNADLCMAVVRETGLSECTFLGPSDVADVAVRYYLAGKELPFAGHPTVATAASMADRGLIDGGQVRFETKAGVIPVEVAADSAGVPMVTMVQNRPEFGAVIDAATVAAVGGISAEDILGEPRLVSTGARHCIAILKDKAVLRRVRLDIEALARFNAAAGLAGPAMTEPFWVTLDGATSDGHTFSRLLLPPPMPAEDPFTGSATGEMAAYLWAEGYLNEQKFVAEQGHWMDRPGRAEVEVLGPRDDISGIRVGGQGYVLMRGYLNL
ncbi:MAG: PhzF family phenazine biosynthesis protein [Rhodobacter sp.]|nr:PhzF family phenazine biosynthesis protein [Rhodobacter sp.]